MAIRIDAARVAAAVSFATLLLIPIAAVARSGGLGFGARHSFVGSPLMQRSRALNAVPYGGYGGFGDYGGFVAGTWPGASYGESNIPPLHGREFPPDPPRVLTCHRSQETMVVPAEGGGEQQIRITRC
jgi:hypothetical protein